MPIAALMDINFDIYQLNISTEIPLADPEFHQPKEVDLLIGASLFWNLLLEGKIQLGKNLPTLHNTHFGYIVTGNVFTNCTASICGLLKVHIPEDEQLRKFWELEEVKVSSILSKDDLECEKQFQNNTFRSKQGQFVVKFPLKYSPTMLGDSKQLAIKRFLSLEKRFSDLEFKKMYFDFIHEYEQLGHMTRVSEEKSNCASNSYFLPHHGVLKDHNITTRLRTVFDGSCPSSSGWSLNDLQFIGPKVQNDITDIMLRFRT
uniref:Peptidase aspartic putative domain-containing protein n=1 Tax=Dendroctonus ponderosae TaxID=77166 RepID=A0AAR5QI49_DENPD